MSNGYNRRARLHTILVGCGTGWVGVVLSGQVGTTVWVGVMYVPHWALSILCIYGWMDGSIIWVTVWVGKILNRHLVAHPPIATHVSCSVI